MITVKRLLLLFLFFPLWLLLRSVLALTCWRRKMGWHVCRQAGGAAHQSHRGGCPSEIDHRHLYESPDVNLTTLFAPEHGVRGNQYAGTSVSNDKDDLTGLPVYSLHGRCKPTPDMLRNVDVIVYDIQDVGCRSYTFISSLGLLMEAAAENDKEVVVLDRPNPLGGNKVEARWWSRVTSRLSVSLPFLTFMASLVASWLPSSMPSGLPASAAVCRW